MRKASYWVLIVVLILFILGITAFFVWYIQKENIFNRLDNELLIDSEVQDYIAASWENDYIYWVQKTDQGQYLNVMRGDGSQQENTVINNQAWSGASNIILSPDANYYAYVCSPDDRSICLYNLKEKILNKISTDLTASYLSWSNDSTGLIFISQDNPDNSKEAAIATLDLDGNNYREIVNQAIVPGIPQNPQYSPDGNSILFNVEKENGDRGIYIMNIDGSDLRALIDSDQSEYEAAYSTDGNSIIYTLGGEQNQIYLLNLLDNSTLQLTEEGDNGSAYFSPDGNRIVYISDRDQTGFWEVYTMNTDGTDKIRLTENNFDDITPYWFRKKISTQNLEIEIQNSQDILEQYLNYKISGDTEKIREYIKQDALDNMDLTSPYENLYLNQIVSFNIVAEKTEGDVINEYEVDLTYQDQALSSEKLFYQLEQIGDKWYIVGVSLADENEEEILIDTNQIQTGSINNDSAELSSIQSAVDDGNEQWRLDPLETVKQEGAGYGFNQIDDQYTLISQNDMGDYSGTGEATVEVDHQGDIYIVQLIQLIKSGPEGIWALSSIAKK